jgi:hypothetical protein
MLLLNGAGWSVSTNSSYFLRSSRSCRRRLAGISARLPPRRMTADSGLHTAAKSAEATTAKTTKPAPTT